MAEQPFIIKFDHTGEKSSEDPKEVISNLWKMLDPMKELAKITAQLKWVQYNELITVGFSESQALQLIKGELKT